jgi:glycine/D-amino acid oxidase-like deaminating enzyme
MHGKSALIIGAGLAGLTAAYELIKRTELPSNQIHFAPSGRRAIAPGHHGAALPSQVAMRQVFAIRP